MGLRRRTRSSERPKWGLRRGMRSCERALVLQLNEVVQPPLVMLSTACAGSSTISAAAAAAGAAHRKQACAPCLLPCAASCKADPAHRRRMAYTTLEELGGVKWRVFVDACHLKFSLADSAAASVSMQEIQRVG